MSCELAQKQGCGLTAAGVAGALAAEEDYCTVVTGAGGEVLRR